MIYPQLRSTSVRVLAATALLTAGTSLPTRVSAEDEASSVSVVVQWNDALLQGVRASGLGPPMVARALAVAHTCMYDAWAAYDRVAVGTRLGASLRRPPGERTLSRKRQAISVAAYRAAVDLLPSSRTTVFDPLMARLGYDPAGVTTDPRSPTGVGNVACAAVLDFRHHDGANQLGDEPGSSSSVPYADYTGYRPANAPMDLTAPFDPASVTDPDRWQPLRYRNAGGAIVTPGFVAPHWNRVVPFALPVDSSERSATSPARAGSTDYRRQAIDLLDVSAHLTDVQKAVAEYWADGPNSELPPGHWDLFAQYVVHRDLHGAGTHGVDSDVQLFFALTNAILDASIVAWDDKRAFDSERPITAIRYLFHGHPVRAWAGPLRGTQLIDGGNWLPYQRTTFPTPPFPEYASGHSTFSAAGAEILRLFSGSDRFGASVTVPAGSSKVEPGAVPATDVVLHWDTFSAAADQAGLSRRYGGIHFAQGDLDARGAGRRCADAAWELAQNYIHGTGTRHSAPAHPPAAPSRGDQR